MVWQIIGARGKIVSVDGMMEKIKEVEKKLDGTIQIFRADRIFGRLHVEVATGHAVRAFERGSNRSKQMGTEILIYCAAERQIKNAIEKLGIRQGTEEFALALSGEIDADVLLKELDLVQDDSVLDGDKDHAAFGISNNDVALVGRERIQDLILEKMALIELER